MIIEVMFPQERNKRPDIKHTMDLDTGPLYLPKHMRIGTVSSMNDGTVLMSYPEQVSDYDVWLEEMVSKQNRMILMLLEEIYTKAQTGGIVLTTICWTPPPKPVWTHAHVVRRLILKLAGVDDEAKTEGP